jgi:hypothetical protein
MGQSPFVGRGPLEQERRLCREEPNGCGGAMREADTHYGTQPTVGEEPLCGLGYGMLGWVRWGWSRWDSLDNVEGLLKNVDVFDKFVSKDYVHFLLLNAKNTWKVCIRVRITLSILVVQRVVIWLIPVYSGVNFVRRVKIWLIPMYWDVIFCAEGHDLVDPFVLGCHFLCRGSWFGWSCILRCHFCTEGCGLVDLCVLRCHFLQSVMTWLIPV